MVFQPVKGGHSDGGWGAVWLDACLPAPGRHPWTTQAGIIYGRWGQKHRGLRFYCWGAEKQEADSSVPPFPVTPGLYLTKPLGNLRPHNTGCLSKALENTQQAHRDGCSD